LEFWGGNRNYQNTLGHELENYQNLQVNYDLYQNLMVKILQDLDHVCYMKL